MNLSSNLTAYHPSFAAGDGQYGAGINDTNDPLLASTPTTMMVIKLVCLSVICFVGIAGNLLICTAVLNRCKSSECFILNLAVADLLVCALGIPLDIYDEVHPRWMYGSVLCKVIYPFQTVLVLVSILTLTAMSLERYRVIITPMKMRLTRAAICKCIAAIWLVSFAVVSPYVNALTYADGHCDEEWPHENDSRYYTLALFIVDYCIPLTVITYCYARIAARLYKSSAHVDGVGKNVARGLVIGMQRDARRARDRRNTRIIKVFSFAVVVFMLCMLPGDIYWMWVSWGDDVNFDSNNFLTFANILTYSNSAINPFIFGSFNLRCGDKVGRLKLRDHETAYSLRLSFTSSNRRRARTDALQQWRRAARKVATNEREKRELRTTVNVVWETNI